MKAIKEIMQPPPFLMPLAGMVLYVLIIAGCLCYSAGTNIGRPNSRR